MIRKRRFLMFLGLFISLFSICTGTQVSNQCTWPQHLRVPGRTGYTHCDGPETSEILWEISLRWEIDIPPLVIGDTIVVLGKDPVKFPGPGQSYSRLLEIDLVTGKVKTVLHEVGEYVDFFYDGSYYYMVDERDYEKNEDQILRLDPDEGSLIPVASVPGIRQSSPDCHAIILEHAIVYPTTPLLCFSRPDFEVLWSTDSVLPNPETTIIDGAVANDSQVFISTREEIRKGEEVQYTHHLYDLSIETGEIIWHKRMGGCLALEEDTLFVGDGKSFYALDATTGQILWKSRGDEIISSNMVLGPHYLSVVNDQNEVLALDRETGKILWKTEFGPHLHWIFMTGGGKYLYSTAGLGERSRIACFNTETGEKVWDYTFEHEKYDTQVRTFPVISKGILVVPLYWGQVYAFGTEVEDELEVTPPPSKPEPTPSSAPESSPPDTQPPTEPPPQTPPAGPEPEPLQFSMWYLLVGAGIIVLIIYVFQKKRT